MTDAYLRRRFKDQLAETLSRFGIQCPPGLTIEVVENTARKMHVVLPAMMLKDDYLRRYEAVDIADADLDAFVTGKTAVSIFQDDFNTVSLRDNVDHDVDVLPFQTNATGDKYKSRAKDTRNDIFGV